MEIAYRLAVPDDKSAVERLFRDMLRSVSDSEDVQGYEHGYLDRFFGGADRIYVAEINGAVSAYISVEAHEGYVYIDDFSVAAEYRSKGIGTALLCKAEEYASEISAHGAELHVESSNEGALRLYKRHGYTVSANEGGRYRMRKEL